MKAQNLGEKSELEAEREKLRHSCEHVLTAVVLRDLGVGKVKMAMGPATAEGFYFDLEKAAGVEIGPDKFAKWEKEMGKIIKAGWTMKELVVDLPEARRFFADNEYKQEILDAVTNDERISLYSLAPKDKNEVLDKQKIAGWDFAAAFEAGYLIDLCRGPHVERVSEIKAWKLLRVAAAYWRGDEKRQQLTRIYGTAYESQVALEEYLTWLEEAKKRDHKRIGREQDLFSLDSSSPGAIYWHPKGLAVWEALEEFGQKLRRRYGYKKIKTPEIAKSHLWQTSGHWDHYRDDMFVFQVDEQDFCLKPMDCPFNVLIYKSRQRSYRDLPIRYTEIGHVLRNEQSGELNGLFRVREITQDDSHLFIREEQILDEVDRLLQMVQEYYGRLGLQPEYFLSTRPENFMGEIETWNKAEANLIEALAKREIKYGHKEKDGAFYGPKIDVNIKDSLGRSWQVATIQLDFQLPGRFGCEYIDESGAGRVPVLIHAAIFGSYERMIGVLLEHYAGRLPVWLAGEQVRILPIADRHNQYAQELAGVLGEANFRVEIDERSERLNAKIRDAQVAQVPVMLIVGDGEIESKGVSVRWRDGRGQGGEQSVRGQEEKMSQKELLGALEKELGA